MYGRSADVLVIEDDPAQAYLISKGLGRARRQLDVVVVGSGAEAMRFLGESGPRAGSLRLIVLDLMLPDADGMQLLERFKTHELSRRVPVIVLTVASEPERVIESYMRSANSYVVKRPEPEFSEALATIARYWLELNEPPVGVA